jgi:hypothetical protein
VSDIPDWQAREESPERFLTPAEGWAVADDETRRVAPCIAEPERRAARMEAAWSKFARDFVLPFIRPRSSPVFAPKAYEQDVAGMVDHQQDISRRARLRCLLVCATALSAGLAGEISRRR